MAVTTARYYTPKGRSIQALGIVPDIVMEGACGDRFLRLGGKQGSGRVEAMKPRYGARRLDMLARGEGTTSDAIDEYFDARFAVAGRKPGRRER